LALSRFHAPDGDFQREKSGKIQELRIKKQETRNKKQETRNKEQGTKNKN
jgi:hypothetical protein